MIATDEQDRLVFAFAPTPTTLSLRPERGAATQGAVYEVSLAAEALVDDIARAIAKHGGAALFIDYGHEGRGFGETLQAVAGHDRADILESPGEADLSAHVDFGALTHTAAQAGARAHGPLGQGAFLRALGIESRAERLSVANPHRKEEIAAAVNRLTDEMGELFKVMAITPAQMRSPPGF
jgi:NADH dehydrogenase [ubiquinone] 1 alpha subcomplex assembly factor 7